MAEVVMFVIIIIARVSRYLDGVLDQLAPFSMAVARSSSEKCTPPPISIHQIKINDTKIIVSIIISTSINTDIDGFKLCFRK